MVVRVMPTLRKVIMIIMIGDGQGEKVGGTQEGRPCTSSAVPPALQIMNNANTNFTSSSSFFSSFSSFFSSSSSLSFSTSSSPSLWLYSISFFGNVPNCKEDGICTDPNSSLFSYCTAKNLPEICERFECFLTFR